MSVALTRGEPFGVATGAPILWTAHSRGHGLKPVYRFGVRSADGSYNVARGFNENARFRWSPPAAGGYVVRVAVKNNLASTTIESARQAYVKAARTPPDGAIVTRTSNPLVARYSAPPTTADFVRVEFRLNGPNQSWTSTAALPVTPGQRTDFLVAGLLPSRTYRIRHVASDGAASSALLFKTGALPTGLNFPTFTVEQRPTRWADRTHRIVFHNGINSPPGMIDTLATDRRGRIVWYYDSVAHKFPSYATSLVPGGTVLLLGNPLNPYGGARTLREVDLAGNTVRQTNIKAVNAQLSALGEPAITDFNHEAERLPNGHTAVLATTARILNRDGKPTLYRGDMVIVLDRNFQVAWVWDPFDWLDPNRVPILGEGPADWTHANSIAWSPADGNLIVSMRSQDWVIKIDYAHGVGTGRILWRLGKFGDFTLEAAGASPWFSHQHDVRYVDDSTIVLFDNGNTRQRRQPNAHSRGQLLTLDERAMRATLRVNADLGEYAQALGGAQRLPNGNLVLTSGINERTIEVTPRGAKTFVLKMNMPGFQYRSYVFRTLYRA